MLSYSEQHPDLTSQTESMQMAQQQHQINQNLIRGKKTKNLILKQPKIKGKKNPSRNFRKKKPRGQMRQKMQNQRNFDQEQNKENLELSGQKSDEVSPQKAQAQPENVQDNELGDYIESMLGKGSAKSVSPKKGAKQKLSPIK